MALFKKVRILYLIFILVFCNEYGKVLANIRSFPDSSGLGKVSDIRVIPSTYEESISNYQERTLFELGSDSRLFGKYQVYAIGVIGYYRLSEIYNQIHLISFSYSRSSTDQVYEI